MNALALQNVSVAHRLQDVSLELPTGRFVGLIGPNGSGKSTLLQAAAGLLPHEGQVTWQGQAPTAFTPLERARKAAWVPQEIHFEFGFSVRSVVGQGRYAHDDDEVGIDEALRQYDLLGLADRPVNQLSGGERQRVILARALATGAPLQLWDEPLAPLDPRHALELLVLGQKLSRSGHTVLFSLHDLRLAHCLDLLVLLDRGRLRAIGRPDEVLTSALLRDVFGVDSTYTSTLTLRLP